MTANASRRSPSRDNVKNLKLAYAVPLGGAGRHRAAAHHRHQHGERELEELGWRARETFETGLEKTVRWFLDNRSRWQDILSLSQRKSSQNWVRFAKSATIVHGLFSPHLLEDRKPAQS